MTWKELKRAVEAKKVKDDDVIALAIHSSENPMQWLSVNKTPDVDVSNMPKIKCISLHPKK